MKAKDLKKEEERLRKRDATLKSINDDLAMLHNRVSVLDNNTDERHEYRHSLSGLNQAFAQIGLKRQELAKQLGCLLLGIQL